MNLKGDMQGSVQRNSPGNVMGGNSIITYQLADWIALYCICFCMRFAVLMHRELVHHLWKINLFREYIKHLGLSMFRR